MDPEGHWKVKLYFSWELDKAVWGLQVAGQVGISLQHTAIHTTFGYVRDKL